jgi:hypothetical protein
VALPRLAREVVPDICIADLSAEQDELVVQILLLGATQIGA